MTDREAIANLTYRRNCWIGLKYVNNKPEPWISGVLEEALQKAAEKNLEDKQYAHSDVIKHWKSIVDGNVPFGYIVRD